MAVDHLRHDDVDDHHCAAHDVRHSDERRHRDDLRHRDDRGRQDRHRDHQGRRQDHQDEVRQRRPPGAGHQRDEPRQNCQPGAAHPYAGHRNQFRSDEFREPAQCADHQAAAEPDGQKRSWDDQAAAGPDGRSNSWDGRAAVQPDGQGRRFRAHPRRADAARRVAVRADAVLHE